MKITKEEKLMYQVMKAINDSGIPIYFKGAMVLKACLYENGFRENMRHTRDIDANWIADNYPTSEELRASLQYALELSEIHLIVRLDRNYGNGRSAGFMFIKPESGEILFSMDLDVNRPNTEVKIYAIEEFYFRGVLVWQILADKIYVVSTDKVFRRIKDVVDLYYLSKCVPMEARNVKNVLKANRRELSDFNGFLQRNDELEHAYEKFRFTSDIEKPEFNKLYDEVKKYISVFLPA